MAVKLANNAVSTLAASITSGATAISIQAADAGKFPTIAANDWHPATIIDASGNMEIVRVTARANNVLTVQRAQEATTAKAFAAGSRIDVRLTAGVVNALSSTDADLAAAVAQKADSAALADLDNATAKKAGDTFSGPVIVTNGNGGSGEFWAGRLFSLSNFAPGLFFEDRSGGTQNALLNIDSSILRIYGTAAADGTDLAERFRLHLGSGEFTTAFSRAEASAALLMELKNTANLDAVLRFRSANRSNNTFADIGQRATGQWFISVSGTQWSFETNGQITLPGGGYIPANGDAYLSNYSITITAMIDRARKVRLGSETFQSVNTNGWNNVPSGGAVSGMYRGGSGQIEGMNYRMVQQTDLYGNWYNVGSV